MLHLCIQNGKRSISIQKTSLRPRVLESCLFDCHHLARRYSQHSRPSSRCDIWKAKTTTTAAAATTTTRGQQHGSISTSPFSIRQTGYGNKRGLLTLAIETSCDDTCVAILEKRSHLDDISYGQIAGGDGNESKTAREMSEPRAKIHFHEKITAKNTGLGGIHPLEALQSHRENLAKLILRSMDALPVVALPLSSSTSSSTSTSACEVVDPRRKLTGLDGQTRRKPDFITVTRGPGMRSNLSCGLDTAKGLSVAWQVPLLGVHHMQAHALTPRLVHALSQTQNTTITREESNVVDGEKNERMETSDLKPSFPFLTLLVSGGHTMLLHSTDLNTHKILATTADIAIGDALDKIGRLLLPEDLKAKVTKDTAYAKHMSEYAFPTPDHFRRWNIPQRRADEIDRPVNEFGWQIHTPLAQTRDMAFSFSSIATRPEKIFLDAVAAGTMSSEERLLLARTALGTAFEHLSSRVVIALEKLKDDGIVIPTLVVSGGVAANDFLRYILRSILDVRGFGHVDLVFPPVALCTDNAAMIAWTGMEMYEAGFRSDLDICSIRKWSMDADSEDGGILGVGGWIQVPV